MSDVLAAVIAKIAKLQALAANNTNVHEMQAAANAADRLMQEYRISQAEIEAIDASAAEPFVSLKVSEGGRRTGWREELLWALVAHYGCCFYFNSGRRAGKGVQSYTVVGRKSDTDIVSYMFSWLEREIARLGRWHAGGRGVGYATSWLMGCAQGVRRQFDDMREAARQAAQQSSAMVLLDSRCLGSKAEMERLKPDLKTGRAVGSTSNNYAAHDGYVVGKTMHIKQGLGGGAIKKAIGS